MIHAICHDEHRVFYMPDRVDAGVLAETLRELLRSRSPWVLDFSSTVHIHYRDLRDFARGLSRARSFPRPLLLAGLSPYCEEIVRFALSAEEGGLLGFGLVIASVSPGGNGEDGEQFQRGLDGIEREPAPAPFPPPCPN